MAARMNRMVSSMNGTILCSWPLRAAERRQHALVITRRLHPGFPPGVILKGMLDYRQQALERRKIAAFTGGVECGFHQMIAWNVRRIGAAHGSMPVGR